MENIGIMKSKEIIFSSKFKAIESMKHTLNRDNATIQTPLIAGMFPRGYISTLASKAGVGKTWLVEKITCDLSLGGAILNGVGYEELPRKCLIFSGETGHILLDRRLKKTNWLFNPDQIAIYNGAEMASKHLNTMLDSDEGKDNIRIIMHMEKPDIVFFDTLISFHLSDENKACNMVPIYIFLRELAETYNCAIVTCHHTRKKQSNQTKEVINQDEVIGSSAGNRLASAVYLIEPKINTGIEEEEITTNIVHNVKFWEQKVPPFSYMITNENGITDLKIELDIKPQWSIKYRLNRFFELFDQDDEGNCYIRIKDMSEKCFCSYETARTFLQNMFNQGLATRIKIQTGEYIYKPKQI